MTQPERTAYRKEKEAKLHRDAIESLTDGWKHKKIGRFLVLIHGDEKFAVRVAKQADAIWTWLDKAFPFFGENEYIPRPIIRVCKDYTEEAAFVVARLGGAMTPSSPITTATRAREAGSLSTSTRAYSAFGSVPATAMRGGPLPGGSRTASVK